MHDRSRIARVIGCEAEFNVLRDFVRTHLFERFPILYGAASSGGTVLLLAWAAWLAGGLGAIAAGPWLAAIAIASAFGGVAFPILIRLARHHAWAAALEPVVFAAGFAVVATAAAVVGSMLVLTLPALLLAALGLSGEAGLAVLGAGSAAAAAVTAGALAWGFARHGEAEVTQNRVAIAGLAPALAGLRIAHLSDLHIGNGLEGSRLDAVVARTNALGADLIAITGDIFDNDAELLDAGAAALAKLAAPLGVWVVLGNHDGFVGADDVAAALAAHAPNLALLRGRVAKLATDAPLHVAGFDDPGHDWKPGDPSPDLDALAAEIGGGPTVLLMHRPDAFPRAAELGFALVLSGHFHGGQVALPVAGGRWNAARLLTGFDRGVYRDGAASLYVTRGIGFAGPRLRFASSPEIAIHELVA